MPSKQDLVTMIVDILRAKQDAAALGPNMAPPRPAPGMAPPRPAPGMLGQGAAAQAGALVSGRDKQVMDYVNQAGQ